MYRYKNMNPNGNNIEDCTIRAISVAEGISWDEAYMKLSESARKMRLMMNSVDAIEEYLDSQYERLYLPKMTVGEFVKSQPYGTYLITMRGHITVLKEGINYDTFDCSERLIWSVWEVI